MARSPDKTLRYEDDMEVEEFDEVEIRMNGDTFEGTITKLHPRAVSVRVSYLDHHCQRRDGEPRKRSAVVPVSQIDLIKRDG